MSETISGVLSCWLVGWLDMVRWSKHDDEWWWMISGSGVTLVQPSCCWFLTLSVNFNNTGLLPSCSWCLHPEQTQRNLPSNDSAKLQMCKSVSLCLSLCLYRLARLSWSPFSLYEWTHIYVESAVDNWNYTIMLHTSQHWINYYLVQTVLGNGADMLLELPFMNCTTERNYHL